MNESSTTLVLADDHPIFLSGLKGLIEQETGFKVLATCPDGLSALNTIRTLHPTIAVLDLSMPGLTGVEVLRAIRSERRPTQVVLLTASATDHQIVDAVTQGARGIMTKDAAAESLIDCLHAISRGGSWLPDHLVASARQREHAREPEIAGINALTPRERELALLVAEGRSNKEIARQTGVTEGTVKIHLHNIYQKLGVANRTAMTTLTLAHRNRLKP